MHLRKLFPVLCLSALAFPCPASAQGRWWFDCQCPRRGEPRRLPGQARVLPATGNPATVGAAYVPPARTELALLQRASVERGLPDVWPPVFPASIYLWEPGPTPPCGYGPRARDDGGSPGLQAWLQSTSRARPRGAPGAAPLPARAPVGASPLLRSIGSRDGLARMRVEVDRLFGLASRCLEGLQQLWGPPLRARVR